MHFLRGNRSYSFLSGSAFERKHCTYIVRGILDRLPTRKVRTDFGLLALPVCHCCTLFLVPTALRRVHLGTPGCSLCSYHGRERATQHLVVNFGQFSFSFHVLFFPLVVVLWCFVRLGGLLCSHGQSNLNLSLSKSPLESFRSIRYIFLEN